mmetsp:Transcript_5972/g.9903  ORF Transcript_5972/g.9903 Transcript_5972/m.9903 type:complete len:97 (+) Transcript_5972:367-657(+)
MRRSKAGDTGIRNYLNGSGRNKSHPSANSLHNVFISNPFNDVDAYDTAGEKSMSSESFENTVVTTFNISTKLVRRQVIITSTVNTTIPSTAFSRTI